MEKLGGAIASRHCEDFQRGVVLAYLSDGLDPIHVGHEKIGHHQIEAFPAQRGQSLASIRRERDLVAVQGEKNLQAVSNGLIIVDDKYVCPRTRQRFLPFGMSEKERLAFADGTHVMVPQSRA